MQTPTVIMHSVIKSSVINSLMGIPIFFGFSVSVPVAELLRQLNTFRKTVSGEELQMVKFKLHLHSVLLAVQDCHSKAAGKVGRIA